MLSDVKELVQKLSQEALSYINTIINVVEMLIRVRVSLPFASLRKLYHALHGFIRDGAEGWFAAAGSMAAPLPAVWSKSSSMTTGRAFVWGGGRGHETFFAEV